MIINLKYGFPPSAFHVNFKFSLVVYAIKMRYVWYPVNPQMNIVLGIKMRSKIRATKYGP